MTKKAITIGNELKTSLLQKFDEVQMEMLGKEPLFIRSSRQESAQLFELLGFPTVELETWRKTNLKSFLEKTYDLEFEAQSGNEQDNSILQCEINQFDTDLFTQYNGKWIGEASQLRIYPNGTIVGSLSAAIQQYPQLMEPYFGKLANNSLHGLVALNTALFDEGYFIYVPDGVDHTRSLQMVNIINSKQNIFTNTRNLVILGKNARLRLVHCDDSMDFQHSFINNVTEIQLAEGSNMEYYKLQNKDDSTAIMTTTFVNQHRDSAFNSNTIVLNGGMVRNDTQVVLAGKGADAQVVGLFLMDRKQFVDNHVFIDHAVANCTSNQLFKGIVDEEARAVFNGHTLVRKDAQQTIAYQSNNNIQLTDTSKIDSHPFLEIYADDVKCSHGATVGQLKTNALFYLMQRGICERNARMLLMVAFVGQIVDRISLPNLRTSINELVRKRLKGELSSCEQCSIQCADPDKPLHFEIDMSLV
jgi:Fe-S cluster assembly protein SufD